MIEPEDIDGDLDLSVIELLGKYYREREGKMLNRCDMAIIKEFEKWWDKKKRDNCDENPDLSQIMSMLPDAVKREIMRVLKEAQRHDSIWERDAAIKECTKKYSPKPEIFQRDFTPMSDRDFALKAIKDFMYGRDDNSETRKTYRITIKPVCKEG